MIDIVSIPIEEATDFATKYDFVGKSHLPAEFGGPYVWLRNKETGRIELAR